MQLHCNTTKILTTQNLLRCTALDPSMDRLLNEEPAIFGQAGICKWEGLLWWEVHVRESGGMIECSFHWSFSFKLHAWNLFHIQIAIWE